LDLDTYRVREIGTFSLIVEDRGDMLSDILVT
jgi:hypothetical protein